MSAVSFGTKITTSSLNALATYANSIPQLTQCAIDPNTGTPPDFYYLINTAIVNTGSGYAIGDTVTTNNADLYEIIQVASNGGMLGIKIYELGSYPYYNSPPISPAAFVNVNSSGIHATLSFGFSSLYSSTPWTYPTPYSFPDYVGNNGNVTSVIPINAGIHYSASNQLYLPISNSYGYYLTCSVLTASALGGIEVLSVNNNSQPFVIPPLTWAMTPTNAPGVTGSGCTIAALLSLPEKPSWVNEFQRIRANAYYSFGGSNAFKSLYGQTAYPLTSQNPYVMGSALEAAQLSFYYETKNNSGVTVAIINNGNFSSEDPVAIQKSTLGTGSTSIHCQLLIGGDQTATFQGQLQLFCEGNYNNTGSVSATTDIPGVSFSTVPFSGSFVETASISNPFTMSISPGLYNVYGTIVNSSAGGITPVYFQPRYALEDYNGVGLKLTYTYIGGGVPTAALCTGSTVNVINCWNAYTSSLLGGFGVYGNQTRDISSGSTYNFYSYWQRLSNLEYIALNSSGSGPSPFAWSGNPNPVDSLNRPPLTAYAHNYVLNTNYTGPNSHAGYYAQNPSLLGNLSGISGSSNSYSQSIPCELQPEPIGWAPLKYYTTNFTIQDSNGNWQQCTTPGFSGATNPTWTTSSYTESGSWLPHAVWTCTNVLGNTTHSIQPGPRRNSNVLASYPCVWLLETDPFLMEPSGSSTSVLAGAQSKTMFGDETQWKNTTWVAGGTNTNNGWQQSPNMAGCFIYTICANRVNQVISSSGVPEQITYQLGCQRNTGGGYGFISWGTYTTGQIYQVLIPIFDCAAAYYSCGERLDVDIGVIGWGSQGITPGYQITVPLVASHLNDTYQMLSLLT